MKPFFLTFFLLFFITGYTVIQAKEPKAQSLRVKEDILKIVDMLSSFGAEEIKGKRVVDTVVVHTAYSIEGSQYEPQNLYAVFEKYGVSPHYMIARDGVIYKMVDENSVAHHAGKSKMKDGREGVNAFSIGIELINSTIDTPTQDQYNSLAKLIINIMSRHKIKHVVGHSDIAPDRKTDPWNFDFTTLNAIMEAQIANAKKANQ